MDTLPKAVLGVIIFFSVWTGSAGKIAYTVEKISASGSPCQLELKCTIPKQSQTKFRWYRGSTNISNDSRHSVGNGGEQLTVTPDPNSDSTVYKCFSETGQENLSVDVAPACNFSAEFMQKAGSSRVCSRVRMAVTIAFQCLWFSALGITAYLCCGQTSLKKAGKKGHTTAKGNEDRIHSHVGIADTGNKGNQNAQTPGPSSTKGAPASTTNYLKKKRVSNFSMITTTAAKAHPQDPTYQALAKDKEEDYNVIKSKASGGKPVVTFSAQNKEVTIEFSLQGLQGGANGQE